MVRHFQRQFSQLFALAPGEGRQVFWSFLYFFSLLASYYILRPVREEMGIVGGVENLPWLFTGTFAAMMAASPLFALMVAKFPKRIFLPAVYVFFILNILTFWVLLSYDGLAAAASRAFFIWTSVYNLFVVSVFWSFMVDLFSKPQAKRLFGMIAAGGTLGTIAGSGVTLSALEIVETRHLLLFSAGLLALALVCIMKLLREKRANADTPLDHTDTPMGGAFYAGFKGLFTNPYLMGIGLFIALYSLTSTFLYFQQADIVSNAFDGSADRTRVFAFINLSVSVLTVVIQMLLTGRFVRRFGVGTALLVLPLVSLAGFLLFSLAPVLGALVAFQIANRTSNFAFTRPAREMLFSVLSEEQKYKAKNVIDTVVYRGSDAFSGWLYAALSTGLGLGLSALAVIAGGVALLWAALAWRLGRAFRTASPDPALKEATP